MKIFDILIFVGAFILITAGLIFLNTMFSNIFLFDFSSAKENIVMRDSTKTEEKKIEETPPADIVDNDSLKFQDSVTTQNQSADSISVFEPVKTISPGITEDAVPRQENEEKLPVIRLPQNRANNTDSTFLKWVKDTAQMFEAMEPKKAAKIIANYSDDNARAIMYKMKKKKAAEILAELDPISANRITRYWESF